MGHLTSVDESQSTTDSRPTSPTSPPPKRVLKADGWIKGGGEEEEEGDDKEDKEKPTVVTRDGEPLAKRWAPNQSYVDSKSSMCHCCLLRTDGVEADGGRCDCDVCRSETSPPTSPTSPRPAKKDNMAARWNPNAPQKRCAGGARERLLWALVEGLTMRCWLSHG